MPEMPGLGIRISSLESLSELYYFVEAIKWREILQLGACIQRAHPHYDLSQLQGNMSPSGVRINSDFAETLFQYLLSRTLDVRDWPRV